MPRTRKSSRAARAVHILELSVIEDTHGYQRIYADKLTYPARVMAMTIRILAVALVLLTTAPRAVMSAGRQTPTVPPQERLQQLEAKVAELEKSGGSNDPALATALERAGDLSFSQGEFAAAEPLLRRALTIREAALGPDHPHTAQALNNLALVLQERGNYPAAQPLLERALALNEKVRGPGPSPKLATALNNLAALHRLTGNYARAEPLYLRALAINEKANGPDHPSVAVVLNNLGLMFQQQGNLDKARPLLERSLAIREKAAGPDHPDVARALNNLGVLFQEQGDLATAERLYQPRGADLREGLRPQASVVRPDAQQSRRRSSHQGGVRGRRSDVRGSAGRSGGRARADASGDDDRADKPRDLSRRHRKDRDAVKQQTESANVTERNLDLILASGSETQKLRYMDTFTENTDITVSMHRVSAPRDAAAQHLALTTLLRRKGRVLDAVGGALQALRDRMSDEDRAALDRLVGRAHAARAARAARPRPSGRRRVQPRRGGGGRTAAAGRARH